MYPGITPELEKAIDELLEWLNAEVSKEIPSSGTNLPWLQHGLRGMFRKFMHGNSPDNPDWYHPEHSIGKRPTLQEYILQKKEAEKQLDEIFEQTVNKNPVVSRMLEQFKKRFLVLLSHYIVGGTTTGGDAERIARAFAEELPKAVEMLNNFDKESIQELEPSKIADLLSKKDLSMIPHVRRAVSNPRYHEKLKDLILRQMGD
jgi:hypothetical protein